MNEWHIVVKEQNTKIAFGVRRIAEAIREETGKCPMICGTSTGGNEIAVEIDRTLPRDAYRVYVPESENDRQCVRISGFDDAAVMYGCMDFAGRYLTEAGLSHTSNLPYYFNRLFGEAPLPAAEFTESPAIMHRGLWTWGLGVYDYRAYLENMARLKLNEVIFWNDFAPVNGREVTEYAHSLGIRVIWGYAWGWDTSMKLDVSEEAADAIAQKYEDEYASLGGDGIYFQSFTETTMETLDGKVIAEAVVEFINRVAARILKRHPDLRLMFGLHASSVKKHMDKIAGTDERIEIIWEDSGDFPYAYLPRVRKDPEGTRAFTEQMLDLREKGGVGAVFKGMICLDWGVFRHQTGPELLGCASERTKRERINEVAPIWHYINAEWMEYGEVCAEIAARFARRETSVYGLVEDGMFESQIPLAAALFAEILWNPRVSYPQLLRRTAERPDVVMA